MTLTNCTISGNSAFRFGGGVLNLGTTTLTGCTLSGNSAGISGGSLGTTGYVGTVKFTSSDGSANLPANYTFTTTDQGVHTFTGLVLRKTGKQTITITDKLNSSLKGSPTEDVSQCRVNP